MSHRRPRVWATPPINEMWRSPPPRRRAAPGQRRVRADAARQRQGVDGIVERTRGVDGHARLRRRDVGPAVTRHDKRVLVDRLVNPLDLYSPREPPCVTRLQQNAYGPRDPASRRVQTQCDAPVHSYPLDDSSYSAIGLTSPMARTWSAAGSSNRPPRPSTHIDGVTTYVPIAVVERNRNRRRGPDR